jgi:hypothetical protein
MRAMTSPSRVSGLMGTRGGLQGTWLVPDNGATLKLMDERTKFEIKGGVWKCPKK